MKNKILKMIVVLLSFIFTTLPVYAADEVKMDGDFSDWSNKPSISNASVLSDDFIASKWYADYNSNQLNLFFERDIINNGEKGKSPTKEDWNFDTYIDTEYGNRKMSVDYHPSSQMVTVTLYDDKGKQVWSDKGKWGDDKKIGEKVELHIPLTELTKNVASGYEITMSKTNEPESPSVTLSTASTSPLIINGSLIILLIMGSGILKHKRQR